MTADEFSAFLEESNAKGEYFELCRNIDTKLLKRQYPFLGLRGAKIWLQELPLRDRPHNTQVRFNKEIIDYWGTYHPLGDVYIVKKKANYSGLLSNAEETQQPW